MSTSPENDLPCRLNPQHAAGLMPSSVESAIAEDPSPFFRPSVSAPCQVKLRVKAQAAGLPCIFADSITREVDIVRKLVQRLRLCDPASAWANAVLASREQPASVTREEAFRAVWSSPFNIRNSAADLEQLYSSAR